MDTDLAEQLTRQAARLVRNIRSISTEATRLGALSIPQALLLNALEQRGGCRAGDIGDELAMTPSVLSRHIADLEALGFVQREVDPSDARARIVTATEAGLQSLKDSRRTRASILLQALDGWSDAEARDTTEALTRFSDQLEQARCGR